MTTATDQRIVMRFIQNDGYKFIPTTAYDICESGRWAWLQKPCVRFLMKTKGLRPHFDKEMMVKQVVIDRDKAAIEIIRMASAQLEAMNGRRIERILVGRKEFEEIIGSAEMMRGPFRFDINLREQIRVESPTWPHRYGTGVQFYSCQVEVIPWMDGILVL